MAERMVTVATFWDTTEAAMARNRLEDAGIPAFVVGDNLATMMPLANAMGGVKLQIREADLERAESVLAEDAGEVEFPEEFGEPEPEEGPPDSDDTAPLNAREELAERAYKSAIFGVVFFPVALYAGWLSWRVYLSDEPMRAEWYVKGVAVAGAMVFFSTLVTAALFQYLW